MSKDWIKAVIFADCTVALSIIALDFGRLNRMTTMDQGAHSVVEIAHINEMQEDLNRKLLESQRKDLGRLDSLSGAILSLIVGENYDRAIEEMTAYVGLKSSFPGFQNRAQRYVQHCSELITAIKTKRRFPGIASLSLAKQQEIHERVLFHFEELKRNLKQIEGMEREQILNDVRSTVWVVKAMAYGAMMIFTVALLRDIESGAFDSIVLVTNSLMDNASEAVLRLVKL
jgi:hypothetical protein